MTKKDYYALIKELLANREDIVEFCDHEIELLDKKKSNGNARANEKLEKSIDLVYSELAKMGKPCTPSELIANGGLDELKNESGIVSSQKVSAYLNKLVDNGQVVKFVEKKKTYFAIKED